MAGLNFDFTGNPTGLMNAAEQSRAALKGLEQEANNVGMSIDNFLGATKGFVTSFAGIGVGVAGLQSFAKELVNVRSEFQDTEARLKVFLGSEEKAAELMEELEDRAWNNSFEFSDITKAAAQLLAFGTEADKVGDTIDRLSEIASGTGGQLGELVEKFNKVKTTGKMDSYMVDSFANLGVDIKGTLAQMEGKQKSDYDGVTITFQQLQKVIHSLTDEGGQFFGMMKERGKNISDSIAGVRDNFALMLNDMGKQVQGPIKQGVDMTNDLIEHWQEVAKVIGGAVVAFGSYKAAMITIKGIQEAKNKVSFMMEKSEIEAITKATKAQYDLEIEELEKKVAAGTAAKNADLELAVAKGTLTDAQAKEIIQLRETAEAQVAALNTKKEAAAAEAAQAAQEYASAQEQFNTAQSKVKMYQEECDQIRETMSAMSDKMDAEQMAAIADQQSIARNNLEAASRELNAAETKKQTAAERAETTSKIAEATAANADVAAQSLDTIGKKVNEKQTKALTRAQAALKVVMQATGLAALANPYVLMAAAIAGVCFAIYKMATAESAAEKAARKHNEALEKQQKLVGSLSDSMSKSDGIISNSTTDSRTKQVEFDAMMNGTKTYYGDDGKELPEEQQEQLRAIEQMYAQHFGSVEAMEAASDEERLALRSKLEADFLLQQKQERLKAAQDELKRMYEWNESLANAGAQGGYISSSKFEKQEELIRLAQEDLAQLQESYDRAAEAAAAAEAAKMEEANVNRTLADTVRDITIAEKELDAARAQYAANASDENKIALVQAESNLQALTTRYKNQTGKAWVDSKQMAEERTRELTKLAQEERNIRASAIADERARKKKEHENTIKELREEEAEYKRTHNGRGSGTLSKKIANANLQFKLDIEDLDNQWQDWVSTHKRTIMQLELDIEADRLQNELTNAMTVAQRNAATSNLRAHEDEQRRVTNRQSADDEILNKLGGDRELLDKYTNRKEGDNLAKLLGIDPETVKELQQIEQHYSQLLDLEQKRANISRSQEDFQQQVSDYMEYCEQITEAAEWRAEQLAAIQSGEEKNRTADMVEADYQAMMQKASRDHDINGGEQMLAELVTRFQQSIVDVTYDKIELAVTELGYELDRQMELLQGEAIYNDEGEVTGYAGGGIADMSEEERNAEALQLEADLRNGILTTDWEIADAEERIAMLRMTDAQITQQVANINKTRLAMEDKAQEAKIKSGKKSASQMQKETRMIDASIQGLQTLKDTADQVADTFGGALSKKGKKALGTISGIADFGMQAIQMISFVSQNTSTLMAATAEGAAGAIQTVEKASVILTIISMAVSVVMALVKVFTQFTTEAQMQDLIDEDIKEVERLKKKQEELQRLYEDQSGSEYYKGMARAASQYNEIIAAQKKALKDANDLAEHNRSKYGSDSGKTKDAEDQAEEQRQALIELQREQKQMYAEMAADLLTTDLSSFCSDLAETMLESFENGFDGIGDEIDKALDDLQRNMMKKGLQIALENLFKNTWDNMSRMTEDGELTQSEMDAIIAEMEAKSAQAKDIAKTYYDAMSERGLLGDGDVEGSRGGFDSMTQDQADELSARFTALQIEGANVRMSADAMRDTLTQLGISESMKLDIVRQILMQSTVALEMAQAQIDELHVIADNTAMLAETNRRLKAIETNTDRL